MKVRHPVLKTFQAYFLCMTLQCRKHWSSFQFLLRVSPKRYIFLPIIIYFGRKTKETGVTFYYLIYFPLKFDLFIVFIILFMKVEDTPFLEGHSTKCLLYFISLNDMFITRYNQSYIILKRKEPMFP